jgi:hypothetical protein
MKITKGTVFLLIALAGLVVPIVYFVVWVTNLLGSLTFFSIWFVLLLILRYIMHKSGFKLPKSENRTHRLWDRVSTIFCSGFLTALIPLMIVREFTGPLTAHYWVPFFILFIVGAFTADTLRKALQKP